MSGDGFEIVSQRKTSRDLSGFPVLMMTETVIESEEAKMRIVRVFAVRGHFFLTVNALNAPIDWDRVRTFLEKVRPLLTSRVRYPG
jgi:hypothetical protein